MSAYSAIIKNATLETILVIALLGVSVDENFTPMFWTDVPDRILLEVGACSRAYVLPPRLVIVIPNVRFLPHESSIVSLFVPDSYV